MLMRSAIARAFGDLGAGNSGMGIIDHTLSDRLLQVWENIRQIDYHKVFDQLSKAIEHFHIHKAISKLWENIRQIDYHSAFNQLWEIIRHIDATAAATIFIAVFSGTLWWVNRRQGLDARVIQRAYVKISHSSPGVEFCHNGHFWHQASVKNFGQTPARVTNVVMKAVVVAHNEPLPTNPDYTSEDPGPPFRAFLVRDDEFFIPRYYPITPQKMEQVIGQSADLYMIGFVDYIDQFHKRYRAGYARQYYPAIDKVKYETEAERAKRNNLLVIGLEPYNYDRLRRQGEGKDWSEDI